MRKEQWTEGVASRERTRTLGDAHPNQPVVTPVQPKPAPKIGSRAMPITPPRYPKALPQRVQQFIDKPGKRDILAYSDEELFAFNRHGQNRFGR